MNATLGSFVDLSHVVEHGMITYKGLPAPIICDFSSREASQQHYAKGTTFQIGKIELVTNTGTYVDVPFPAVPAKIKGLGTFPVRAFGLLDATTECRTRPS